MTEHSFQSFDGASIRYRAWLPDAASDRTILLFHRGHEHGGRWTGTVDALADDRTAIFAWDQRGHGRSDGERGKAPSVAAIVRDAECFARHLEAAHGVTLRNTAVIASSLGAVIATAWVHDYAPPIRALVLAAPAFEVKLYVPLAVPGLRFKERVLPGGEVKSFVRSSMISSDPDEQRAYDNDPLIFRQIAINLLLDLHDIGKRLVDDAAAITTPTLLLIAEKDWVVKRQPQVRFFERLASPTKRLHFAASGKHALFHDRVTPAIHTEIRAFLDECFSRDASPDLLHADRGSASRTEYDLLRMPSNLKWRATRQIVKIGGLFSDGIRLGLISGFDSGESLDYVYRNRAAGRMLIGGLIDRGYLDAIGWRGIRVRRQHLDELLRIAVDRSHHDCKPVHILDIAAGPGRYVLEFLRDRKCPQITAELRDYRQSNLDAASELANSLGVTDRVSLKLADAFDPGALASTSPRPTVAIVSGLYELFPENQSVRRSLAGIAAGIEEGGYLIYTGQPWHPQVEFIARALINREGQPWIMRRRSQAEMDALVREAGFEKIEQRIDRWGILTVSLARRLPRKTLA